MKIKKAVIPAAGLGTRMLPISKTIPKEMLPIGQKPMIQYAVEEAVDCGIEQVIIVINSEKELIKKYFLGQLSQEGVSDEALEKLKVISSKAELVFLYQDHPKGLADAISLSRETIKRQVAATKWSFRSVEQTKKTSSANKLLHGNSIKRRGSATEWSYRSGKLTEKTFPKNKFLQGNIIKDEPFALLLPDNILFSDTSPLHLLVEVFNKYKKDVGALTTIYPEEFKMFGNCGKVELEKVAGRVYSIKEIKDKEKGAFVSDSSGPIIRGFARNILFPHFYEYIEKIRSDSTGELDDVPVFQLLLKEKGMLGCLLEGKGYDAGNPLGYHAANRFAQTNVIKPTI